jgi:hypothetical protein
MVIARWLCIFAFATALFGQIDTDVLRAKYGPPLARETFVISPGFQLVVDYGSNRQVCRLELRESAQQADDILLELVPMSLRGKNLGTMFAQNGLASVKITDYEQVMISEPDDLDHPGRRSSVSLRFKREDCRSQ